jgi:hypothetical protein
MPVRFGEQILANGELYTYHVTFVEMHGGIVWHAIVRNEAGVLRGTPAGTLGGLTTDSPDIEDAIRDAVVAAIDTE